MLASNCVVLPLVNIYVNLPQGIGLSDIVFEGTCFTITWATTAKGRRPAEEFFNRLSAQNQAKLLVLFELLGDVGRISNIQHFRKIAGTECFEFKRGQIRLPCFFYRKRTVVITHGFVKKSTKTPVEEIGRALRIRHQHISRGER